MIIIYQFANQPAADTSSFHHFLVLMSKIGFGILSLVLIISLLSTLVACFYFIRHREYFHVEVLNNSDDEKKPTIEVHTFMQKIFRPLLGSIQVRYEYNDHQLSPTFSLSKENNFSFFPTMGHRSNITLPNIKEYKLDAALLSFQDLFRFFSFTFKNTIQSRFINLPKIVDTAADTAEPKTTDDDDIRTQTLRKIPGEWLEYKKYEASDDIRRIVWKAFAKNKELVVRKQETLSPYASHINCYASFYTNKAISQKSADAMADYYKNYIWSFFNELRQSEFQVKLHFEQLKQGVSEKAVIAEQIAQAEWQQEILPSRFFDTKKGSVLFLHSLLPTKEIHKIVQTSDKNTLILYVDLSTIFNELDTSSWWSRIFFKPKFVSDDELISDWKRNAFRLSSKKNVQEHIDIISNSLAQIEIVQ
jgi:hypothetical protein